MSSEQIGTIFIWIVVLLCSIIATIQALETFFIRHAKKYAWAIKIYSFKIFLSSKNDDFYVNRGWAYAALKDFERAIQDYNQAIEIDDENSRAYLNRGFAHLQLKLYEKTIEDCDKAIALNTAQIWVAYNNRGFAFQNLKEYRLAIKDFDEASKAKPTYFLAYRNRGYTYYLLKEYQSAIQSYKQALALNPDNIWVRFNCGLANLQLKQYELALQDYNRTIELDPLYCCAYNNRGTIYTHLNNLKQARADFIRAWELNSEHISHGLNVEWFTMSMEQPDSAMAERLEKMASIDTEDHFSYVCRGIALWLQENYEQASVELEQALAMEAEIAAFFWKGVVCASLRRDEEAMDEIQQAIDLNMPSLSLLPLRLFEQKRPDFYETYIEPLLERYIQQ